MKTFNSDCRICGGSELNMFVAREMMYGQRERFEYEECMQCGCVQISEYPGDIGKYYPSNYYSFSAVDSEKEAQKDSQLRKIARNLKAGLANATELTRRRFLQSEDTKRWLASHPIPNLYCTHVMNPHARILDVGCGGGSLLQHLHYLYYTNLHGCDPFIARDVYRHGRLLIRKASLHELTELYDCISFHHVFEHMPDQLGVLNSARERLTKDGILIIRVPVASSEAWRTYGSDWVQLDPPRHYYLHTERSFRLLADQAGFQVQSIEYDSSGFQFWGSELYKRDIPLLDEAGGERHLETFFSADQLANFEARARKVNQARDGDQIVAILRPNS